MKIRTQIALLVTTASGLALAHKTVGPDRSYLPSPVVDADYYDDGAPSDAKVELGRQLFFDKVLSGNKNISCATCHHPEFLTGDGLALPLGEGATGLGTDRYVTKSNGQGVHGRVPRNSPPLYNLGAREYERMFHDGRVETDPEGYYEGGFITPAKWKLPTGLDNPLAAQAMFPPTSPEEMAGQQSENDVANARALNNAAGKGGIWEILGHRLAAIPEYVELFSEAYPDQVESADDVNYVLAANALAAFQAKEFRADNSPFDQYLRGQTKLSSAATRGMDLFYGKASCNECHTGKFQTDQQFHAIAMPQIGPGKSDGADADYWRATGQKAFLEDYGRGRVTVRTEDNFKFRTPSLRNVAITGPWGHDGAYQTLEGVVRHHLNPVRSLNEYELAEGALPTLDGAQELTASGSRLSQSWLSDNAFEGFKKRDAWVQSSDKLRGAIAAANELEPIELTDAEVADLLAFLESLTDPNSLNQRSLVPATVPSGLPVID